MKAMSTLVSPVISERTRPPWLRMMARPFSLPAEMAWPILPRTPEASMRVMVPSSIMGTSGSWALPREVAARVMFLRPILWISSITMLTIRSPSRKW